MAHGLNSVLKRGGGPVKTSHAASEQAGKGIGSRRIFAPHFKLQVLDSYRNDADCKGNQRATARKYGIHRRQIQKWLQAEGALRSTVNAKQQRQQGGERSPDEPPSLSNARQLDDTSVGAACAPVSAPASAVPLDLSVKRPPTPSAPPRFAVSPQLASPDLPQPHPDVWDLSTKGLKRKSPSPSPHTSPKPVKLFKPYLDDIAKDLSPKIDSPPSIIKLEPLTPCCSTIASSCEAFYYNNNNLGEVKSEYGCSYTLHELQPKSSMSYYYTYPTYSGDYEVNGGYVYEDISYGQNLTPLKQRQSYSLDFKLSAIDCYYQDSVCKGNQRAVATKYNIHRRQIQKWLKQAEELRSRNETTKTHAVR